MITPNFELIPNELTTKHRWVTWKDQKVPYIAALPHKKASVTNSATWGLFSDAKAAYHSNGFEGVGFVLNGDGITGIDLDDCVSNGQVSKEAMQIMEHLNCSYIEISPSGRGLRGFGFAEQLVSRNKGVFNNTKVEIYSTKRYLTVTGRIIRNESFTNLNNLIEISAALAATEENGCLQKSTDVDKSVQILTEDDLSILPCSSVNELPAHLFPTSIRQRNTRVFELARYLKAIKPEASKDELRQIVLAWHEKVSSIVGTKEFSITWYDFLRAWNEIKQPYGERLQKALYQYENLELSEHIEKLGYGESALRLIKICKALQIYHENEPFFISVRKAGELIDEHFTDAAKILNALVCDEILELVTKGTGNKASRYRMKIG